MSTLTAAPRCGRALGEMALRLPRRILVGYDGSDGAGDALAMARDIVRVTGAELDLVGVDADMRGIPTWPELEDGVHEILGDRTVRMLALRARSAPAGLHHAAVNRGADLIVVGSSSHASLGRVLPGGIGTQVLDHAPCAVGISPRGYARAAPHRLRSVGVGYDGSAESREALRTAAALARAAGGPLRIVTVVEPPDQILAGLPRDEALAMVREGFLGSRHRRWMRNRLDEGLMQVLWEIAVDGRLVEGRAATVLRCEAGGLDLMLLGSRGGYGPVRRLLLGSVAVSATSGAACPTILVARD